MGCDINRKTAVVRTLEDQSTAVLLVVHNKQILQPRDHYFLPLKRATIIIIKTAPPTTMTHGSAYHSFPPASTFKFTSIDFSCAHKIL